MLEPVARRMRPAIDQAIRDLEQAGAVGARMTGSGSAVFGVFMHAGACRRAAHVLESAYPGVPHDAHGFARDCCDRGKLTGGNRIWKCAS